MPSDGVGVVLVCALIFISTLATLRVLHFNSRSVFTSSLFLCFCVFGAPAAFDKTKLLKWVFKFNFPRSFKVKYSYFIVG